MQRLKCVFLVLSTICLACTSFLYTTNTNYFAREMTAARSELPVGNCSAAMHRDCKKTDLAENGQDVQVVAGESKAKEDCFTSVTPMSTPVTPMSTPVTPGPKSTPVAMKYITDQAEVIEDKKSENLTAKGKDLALQVDEPIWSAGLRELPWTSLYGQHENDSFHFFSAYFDDRVSAPGRPAVLVLGYSYDAVYNQNVKFYCVFKYGNGSSMCRRTPTTDQHPNTCLTPSLGAKPRHYICGMKDKEEPPIYVQLSTSSGCEPDFTSGEIPVRNRNKTKATKKFGICLSGPLIQESRAILQDLIQFIELSQLMGAEFIVMYANETQIDADILEYLWTHFPGMVRTTGWKAFAKWHPLHYYGQLLIMSDYLYQVMYEVEYLAMMDIDEMIVPRQHNNWGEMIESFVTSQTTTSFRFQNAFFADPDPLATAKLQAEMQTKNPSLFVPKYFSHTQRYRCNPYTNYRTKMIHRPRFVIEAAIHGLCKAVAGRKVTYSVPIDIGFLAHYRHPIPDECKMKSTYTDTILDKYKLKLNKILQ